MTKIYELVDRSGTKVIPVGKRYKIVQAEIGSRAIILNVDEDDGGFITSPIKKVTTSNDELIIVTQNTVYTFKEASQ